jgi:hypothetical protein
MPIKKITIDQFPEENEDKATKSQKILFGLIIGILVLFACNVVYETVTDVQAKFEVSESDSKTCLIDFQNEKCNALSLSEKCSSMLDCVQKEKKIDKFAYLTTFCA